MYSCGHLHSTCTPDMKGLNKYVLFKFGFIISCYVGLVKRFNVKRLKRDKQML